MYYQTDQHSLLHCEHVLLREKYLMQIGGPCIVLGIGARSHRVRAELGKLKTVNYGFH